MRKHAVLILLVLASIAAQHALAQSTISVDLLGPGDEGFAGIPAYRRCVDVFVDIDSADVWTASGIRVTAHPGARFVYWDVDPNFGEVEAPFNLGTENKFATSLSRPRARNENARFTSAGAASAGAFDPPGAVWVGTNTLFNIAYFASPPMTSGSPSADGYIARISIDVRDVVPTDNYAGWFAGDLADAPAGALIVLRSEPVTAVAGTVFTTFDNPTIRGINWGLWYVPEPATICGYAMFAGVIRLQNRPSRLKPKPV
jgi:hypothetical protein